MSRLAVTIALSLMLVVAVGQPAAAHTELTASTPADGSHLDSPPDAIVLSFSEAMSADLSAVSLSIGGARPMPLATRTGQAPTELVAAVPPTSPGADQRTAAVRWQVAYRVVSRDGHPVTGEVAFAVRQQHAAPTASAVPSETAAPIPPADGENSAPIGEDSDGRDSATSWSLIVVAGAVLLVLLVLAGAGAVRLARRDPTP